MLRSSLTMLFSYVVDHMFVGEQQSGKLSSQLFYQLKIWLNLEDTTICCGATLFKCNAYLLPTAIWQHFVW